MSRGRLAVAATLIFVALNLRMIATLVPLGLAGLVAGRDGHVLATAEFAENRE